MTTSTAPALSLHGLLDALPDAALILGSDGRVRRINALAEKLFAYRRGELNGQRLERLLPEHPARPASAARYSLTGRRRDGHEFPVEVSLSPAGAQGSDGIILIVRDASERKKAEDELRRRVLQQEIVSIMGQRALKEESLQRLLDESTHLLAKGMGAELVGLQKLQSCGKELLLVAGTGFRDGMVGSAREAAGHDSLPGYTLLSSGPIVVEDLRKDVRFVPSPLLGEHGVVSGICVIVPGCGKPWGVLCAHVTRQRGFSSDDTHFVQSMASILAGAVERHEHARQLAVDLETSRERLAAAQQIAGIGTWDLTGDAVTLSEEMCRIHGQPAGACCSSYEQFLGSLHEEDRKTFKETVAEAQSTGAPFNLRYRILRPDGTMRWIKTRGQAVREPGTWARVAGIAYDVTARVHAEEAETIKSREQQQREFVANVSHEFRTPLAAIQAFAETLRQDGLKDRRNGLRFLGIIERHARRLASIVEDLLELSDQEHGVRLRISPVPVWELAERVRESLAPLAAKKAVTLRVRVPKRLIIPGDEARLTQVLQNLVSNAINYNKAGGSVTVSAESRGPDIFVSVADTGAGIAPEQLPRLFIRFHRAHDKAKSSSTSTGLGLAICKGLVEAHGGRIWAESKPGKGSIFRFAVPATRPDCLV